MSEIVLTVKALKGLVKESSNEFKAKLGPGVESADKENGKAYYSDAKKRAKDFDGGLEHEMLEEKPEYVKTDTNKTTLDYTPDNASDEYKKRVHAQVKGYTSEDEMNNGYEKAADFSDGDNIYNGLKKSGEKMQKDEKAFRKSGLQARELPDEFFDRGSMYESKEGFDMRKMIEHLKTVESESNKPLNENIKTIAFKRTKFLTENHMVSRIPDDFKVNGLKFKMKDSEGDTYLVEWKNNVANVLSHTNKVKETENFNRMKELMEYKTKDTKTTTTQRLNENDETLRSGLDIIRGLNQN